MILFPNAKINIGLNILNKRNDGFHELETFMIPVPLTDIMDITKPSGTGRHKIKLSKTGIAIDGTDENNLVHKAYQLLDKNYDLPSVNVHLHKSIPFGAGLGGGSADGAFMLKGLNDFFDLNLSDETLEHLAAKLGSDCPFFIKNQPALATGRGEKLEPFKSFDFSGFYLVLVVPREGISTRKAYSGVTPQKPKKQLKDFLELSVESWNGNIINDFEESVFSQKPEIGELKKQLIKNGAVYASLSGSGSAVYGLFRNLPNLSNEKINAQQWVYKL